MADVKISALTPYSAAETTALAPDDYLVMVDKDVGDTGTTYRTSHIGVLGLAGSLSTDHTYSGVTIRGKNFGYTASIGDPVYLGSGGTWLEADATDTTTAPARGVAVNTGSSGTAAVVLVLGTVRHELWNWTTIGQTIYLSESLGEFTATAPTTSGAVVQVVGFALSADEAFFNFTGHYLELE